MDHFFEQKLVRENQQLNNQLHKLNKQIKELQEKVVGYEHMLNELNVSGAMKTGYKQSGAMGALKAGAKAVAHNTLRPSAVSRAAELTKQAKAFKASSESAAKDEQAFKQQAAAGVERVGRTTQPSGMAAMAGAYKTHYAGLAQKTQGKADRVAKVAFKLDESEKISEELKGNQHKIDANKNGQIDAEDFKLLRKKKVNEGHSPEQLKKLDKSELNKLKSEYIAKRSKAQQSGNLKAAAAHSKELKSIKNLITKKSIKEELLNEIGDTPMGELAIKLAKARAGAKLEWDKSVSTSFAKHMGKPGDVEKVKKDIAGSERTIKLANKKLGIDE